MINKQQAFFGAPSVAYLFWILMLNLEIKKKQKKNMMWHYWFQVFFWVWNQTHLYLRQYLGSLVTSSIYIFSVVTFAVQNRFTFKTDFHIVQGHDDKKNKVH